MADYQIRRKTAVMNHQPLLAFPLCFLVLCACCVAAPEEAFPDIRSIPPDLTVPPVTAGPPGPGKRVRQTAPEYAGTEVHHMLYLPRDWRAVEQYPVIVEYAGNGPYESKYGDVSSGEVEGSKLGYGLSGGEGFIWLCLPCVNTEEGKNQSWWWGDVEATVEYCKRTVPRVCEQYRGDPTAVILTGFSRGAIACNFIGLHDDEIARLWLAFMPYSHYDGVREWDYAGSDRASAWLRLQRLQGRASFITHERSVDETRRYLAETGIEAPFTFKAIPFRNHNDAWALRDIPVRREARRWLEQVLAKRPGRPAPPRLRTGTAVRLPPG